MQDYESEVADTRVASPEVPEAPIDQVEFDVEAQDPKKELKGWAAVPLWKRRTLIGLLLFLLFLIVLVSVLYGVVYCIILSSFNGNTQFPQFELSELKDGSINTRLIYAYNLTSSMPLLLHDYNLTYATPAGAFAQMLMPGYFIRTRPLFFQADTVMYITNDTILGDFGNDALSILTGDSDAIVPKKVSLSSDMSVNCGIPGLTFVHWTIPFRAEVPFELTSLGNLGSIVGDPKPDPAEQPEVLKTQQQLQSEEQPTTQDVTIFPVLKKKNSTTSVSNVRLRLPRFWLTATVNFTNPAPLALNLTLLKGQIYSYENKLAEVFVENFALLQGNNSIPLTFWVTSFKGFVKTAVGAVFHGVDVHQFSLRNITVEGESGTVKWINKWFSNITLQLPRVNYTRLNQQSISEA